MSWFYFTIGFIGLLFILKEVYDRYFYKRWNDEEEYQRYLVEKELMDEEDVEDEPLKCNHCGSTQLSENRSGYGLKKGLGGLFLTGGIGLLAGFIGSNKITITCLKCGKDWKPSELND